MLVKVIKFLLLSTFVVVVSTSTEKIVQKRQIFREQVLPHAGGKIPDTAFQTDRLFLNRLQKEGIAIPDGIVLEQRNPQVYPFSNKQMRTVYKVALSSDGRYTANEGKRYYETPPSVETTYLFPQVHSYPERVQSSIPAYPVYKQIQIQNSHLNQPKLQPKKKSFFYSSPYSKNYGSESDKIRIIKPQTQTINLLNDPINTLLDSQFGHSYEPSHLFNEFDNLFNGFQLDGSRTYKSKPDKKSLKNHE